jgi:hypothetical protein
MATAFRQRFQYRPLPKAFLLNFLGIASYTGFRFAPFVPFFVIGGQIKHGYHPRALWWLLAAPGTWLLAHVLWWVSDFVFFHVNRREARRDQRGFFLLLRPFKQTAATAIPGAVETPDLVGHLIRGTHPLIWQYGIHLAPHGRLLGVGKVRLPKPVLSNDTVSVLAKDDNWMEIVRELAERCRAIIVFIDEGQGLLDELKHLCGRGLTRKTIIRVSPIQSLAADPEGSQRRWNRARHILIEQGMHPPEATPDGFLYIPHPDLSISHRVTLTNGTDKAIDELLRVIEPSGPECSLRQAMTIVDAFERRTFGSLRVWATLS